MAKLSQRRTDVTESTANKATGIVGIPHYHPDWTQVILSGDPSWLLEKNVAVDQDRSLHRSLTLLGTMPLVPLEHFVVVARPIGLCLRLIVCSRPKGSWSCSW
jgi:hypothetical protein